MITIPNYPNKHDIAALDSSMEPIGWVHCFSATEWQAFNADGQFINWFASKQAALKALEA